MAKASPFDQARKLAHELGIGVVVWLASELMFLVKGLILPRAMTQRIMCWLGLLSGLRMRRLRSL